MDKTSVLVVEDDSHLLSGIRDILELENYAVTTAHNGLDGLSVLQKDVHNPPDVIVSDIMMPHMDGYEFLEAVRKEDAWVHVPFIFLTAKGERTDRHRGSMLGADSYLTKPFDAEDLLIAISSTLRRHDNIKRVKETELDTQKRKILTILNHEMRTPLTLVVAYAEMLKEFESGVPEDAEDEMNTFLRGVGSGADRLKRLIENFIYVVEIDTGEAAKTVAWRKQPVEDLHMITRDALRQVENPEEKPRNFEFHIADELPTMEFDVQYVTVAIRELLDNAIKFCDNGDTVTLTAVPDGDFVAISIHDPGRGIPEHELENIWKPFYQIDREKHEDQGSGSGLTIVKNIIQLHGGTVDVDSTLGEGSTFTIQVPVKKPATVSV